MASNQQTETPTPKKKRRWKIILISILAVIIVARIILPFVVLKYVNKTLSDMGEYRGHVEDINIAIIRGAYKIIDIQIDKVDTLTNEVDSIPFFTCADIDLSVEWRALFKGRVVGEIYVEEPILNFVQGKHKDEDAKADTADFKEVIRKLMPLTINHFQINNGEIHFRDPNSKPVIDVPLTNIQVQAENLSNANDSNLVLPSTIKTTAELYGGKLNMDVKLNPLEKQPTFDLTAKVENVNMVNLNPFFKAYGNFEVEKGSFGLYTEFAAKDGAFNGYVKPLLKDIDIEKKGTFGEIVWANVVGAATWVFENHKKDQVATKIPIEGRFDNPNTRLWTAISYVLKNAFVFALKPSVDESIDIGKVEAAKQDKTFLQKIFGKKDGKQKK